MIIDATDQKIIEYLERDGRMTMKQLGELVHLSAPAVIGRVKRLEDEGIIIGYAASISPKAMGYNICADILVLLANVHRKKEFIEYLQTETEILSAHETMGRSDAILQVKCRDMESLWNLAGRLQAFGHTESYVHMSRYK